MRATEIIRNLLDVIDQIDHEQSEPTSVSMVTVEPVTGPHGDDVNRFKQIFDLLNAEKNQVYNNSPAEVVTSIDSVTKNAGGGWNGPKNPADIRADSISMYPQYQQKPGV